MDRIVTYSLEDNFIIKLADYIEQEYLKNGKDLSRLAVVFGGRRPALFLKKELSARIKGAFFPPRFFAIDDFVDYLLAQRGAFIRISDLDACYSIYQLAKERTPDVLRERPTFAQFLPWAREILAFIEQLDLEDIRSVALENIQLKAEIGYDVPESINRLLAGIITLRGAFADLMRAQGAYSRGYRYLQASRVAEEAELPEFDEVIFAGFFYLHATETSLIKSIYARGKGRIIFQGSSDEWSVLKENAADFGLTNLVCPKRAPLHQDISILTGYDIHAQAGLVRQSLSVLKNRAHSVVVLPEAEHIIPLLSEISCVCDEFNVSMGYPLARSAVYSLFRTVFKAQESRRDGAYYARDYLSVLRHPLVKSIRFFENTSLNRILIHKVEEILTGLEDTPLGGSLFIGLDEIEGLSGLYDLFMNAVKSMGFEVARDEIKEALGGLHKLLFRNWEAVRHFKDFATCLEAFLDLLAHKSNLGRFPLNIKMAQSLLKLCDELHGSSFNEEAFVRDEIFKIFRDTMEHAAIRFQGSPLKGLQILGILETRSLSFDNVIIMDVNEAALPNLKIYEPLIPREVMIHLGLNRLEKEDQIQRYQFRRLIAGARNVTLIYQGSPDKEKSRFIEELVWERQRKENSLKGFPIVQGTFKIKVLPERMRIPKDDKIVRHLSALEYSASSINTYLDCPLRFYYRYVLGLQEKEDLLDEPEGADIGNYMHDLLKDAFFPFIGRRPQIDEEFIRLFHRIRDARFEQAFARKMKSDSFLLKGIIDVRLEQFLDNERRRRVREIVGLEKKLKGSLHLDSGTFRVQARIDRIDRLDDELLVLDYKTGSTDSVPEADPGKLESLGRDRASIKRAVKSFQLPLYLYLVDEHGLAAGARTNAALYSLRDMSRDFGISALFKREDQFAGKKKVMACYLNALDFLFSELLDPGIPFRAEEEEEHFCHHCPFFYLCR